MRTPTKVLTLFSFSWLQSESLLESLESDVELELEVESERGFAGDVELDACCPTACDEGFLLASDFGLLLAFDFATPRPLLPPDSACAFASANVCSASVIGFA